MSKKAPLSTDTADTDDQTATPAKRDRKDGLRAEVDQLKNTVNQTMIAAAIAIVAAVSTPAWAPYVSSALNDSDPTSARVLVMAVEQLRPALNSAAPFEQQMTLIRRMLADDREVMRVLEKIEAAAPYGVPSSEEIRSGFMTTANQVFVAELFRIQPDERWLNRALVRVASAMRPHDLARSLELNSVGPASALLAEAAHRLSQDDLPNAIRAMEHLHGSYAPLAAPWLAKARVRYEAGRAFEMLEALAATRLPAAYKRPASDTSSKVLNDHRHN